MGKYTILEDWITDIADAIREKTESSSKIIAENFPEVIAAIPTKTGLDTSDATATIADLRKGATAYAQGVKIIGSIEDYDGEFILT